MKRALAFLVLLLGLASAAPAEEIEVRGRVLAESGEAIAGARISLRPLSSLAQRFERKGPRPGAAATARTDASGDFRLAAPEPGLWELVARHPRHLPARSRLPLFSNVLLPDLELPERARLEVRVVDARGEPRAGVRLHARPFSESWVRARRFGWEPLDRRAATGENGRALLPAGAGETLQIAAVSGGHYLYRELEPGVLRATLRLDRELAPARLEDASGRPVTGARVFFGVDGFTDPFAPIARTDEQGRARLPIDETEPVPLFFLDAEGLLGAAEAERRDAATEGPRWVLRLSPVVRLDGRVVDKAGGGGVPGAWLWTSFDHFRAGDDGGFRWRLPRSRYARLRAAAPGYRPVSLRLSGRAVDVSAPLRLALEPQVEIAGRVLDERGEPLAGARIEAFAEPPAHLDPVQMHRLHELADPRRRPRAESDAAGRFRLSGLSAAWIYRLRAILAGYAPGEAVVPPRSPGGDATEALIELAPGLAVEGFVVERGGGPIAGAEVEARRTWTSSTGSGGGSEALGRVVCDAAGRFRIGDLAPGTLDLEASAPGFPPRVLRGVELTAEAGTVDVGEVILDPALRLEGRVRDPDGRPLAGARVTVRRTDRPDGRFHGELLETGADGGFVVESLPAGARFVLQVVREGFLQASFPDLRADSEAPLEIVLMPGIVVRGRVVDGAGGAASATVELRRGHRSYMSTTADGEGRFAFPEEEPGRVRLSARSEAGRSEPIALDLEPGIELPEVILTLEPAAAVGGWVLDENGAAVAAARLKLELVLEEDAEPLPPGFTAVATASPVGRFDVGGLEPGPYLVSVEHPEHAPAQERIELTRGDVTEVEIVLEELARRSIEGTVLDPAGAGLKGATVRLLREGRGFLRQTVTVRGGRFELEAPGDGVYRLQAEHPELAPVRSEPLEVGAGGVTGIVLALEPESEIAVEVTGLTAEELERVMLMATSPELGARWSQRVGVGAAGAARFRIAHLAAGEWQLKAWVGSRSRAATRQVELAPGEKAQVELRFEPGYRLSGLALRAGSPLVGASLEATCREEEHRQHTATDLGGRFEILGLPAGECLLTFTDRRDGARSVRRLEISSDAEVTIEIEPVELP